MRALLHMKAKEEERTRGVRGVSTGVEIVLLAQGRFAYMCSEFKCQTAGFPVASHAGVFRGARISSLPTNACSTENNIPFSLFYLRGR